MANMHNARSGHQQGSARGGTFGGQANFRPPRPSGSSPQQSAYRGRPTRPANQPSYIRQQWKAQPALQPGVRRRFQPSPFGRVGQQQRASAAPASPSGRSSRYWHSMLQPQMAAGQARHFVGRRAFGAGHQQFGGTSAQNFPGALGQRGGRGGGWRRWGRRWPWLYRSGSVDNVSPQMQYIMQIQACLAQVLGAWVPQDGNLGRQTKLAIRTFQGLQQMPETGVLDQRTASAIQAACRSAAAPSPGAMQAPDAAPVDAGGPPDAAAAPDASASPDASAAPANGGSSIGDASATAAPGDDAAAASGDAGDSAGEISFGEFEGEGEQEFVLSGPCSVEARTQPKVPLTAELSGVPEQPGVYVIYVNDDPWYVGVAEEGIRKRFLHRLKVLRDLRIPSSVLQGRSIEAIPLIRAAVCRQALSRRSPGKAASPVSGKNAVLKVLEQLYIRKLRTAQGKGNRNQERVVIDSKGGSLSVQVDGQPVQVPLQILKSRSGQVIGQAF